MTTVHYPLRIYRAQRAALVMYARRVRADLANTESDPLIWELDAIHDAMLEARRLVSGK